MTNFRYYLRTGSKKDLCPNCNKKTYVPYLETESGNEINAGRCDRQQNCGYHKKPESNEPIFTPKYEALQVKTDYINLQILHNHYLLPNKNNFLQYLRSKYPEEKVKEVESLYFLADKGKSVIFWQIDQLERIRSGKIMEYNPVTGKRVKDESGKSAINWMHKQPFNLKQCLFGLHLSKEYPDMPIGIVESEKTSILMHINEPRLLWMACGSLGGFKIEMLAPLRLRKIVAFPDKGCFENWNEKAQKLNEIGFSISVSGVLENNPESNIGDDIADLL
jgi:hypothetical protein